MRTNKSGGLILAAFCIAVTLAVALVLPVFAQDDPLPPPEPNQTTESVTAPGTIVVQDSDETLPVNPTPLQIPETEPLTPATPSLDSSEEMESDPSAPAQESLAHTLAENDLVIADPNGAPLSLVSNAVSGASDPYFTVGTTKYQFLFNADPRCGNVNIFCSDHPIQAAVDKLVEMNWVPVDGTIYVESGTYTENVTIDGSRVYGTTTSKPLSLLKALKGAGSYETTDEASVINGSVTVKNVLNGFILSGFVIDATGVSTAGVGFDNNTGTITIKDVEVKNSDGDGISVTNQKGGVILDTVTSHNNSKIGTNIDNSSATFLVNVVNSSFTDNSINGPEISGGLLITTTGSVSITGVTSNGNHGYGIKTESGNATVKHVQSNYNTNPLAISESGGVLISSNTGSATLEDIEASFNDGNGLLASVKGTISASQITAKNNSYAGIAFDNYGLVSLKGFTSNQNGREGINVNNSLTTSSYSVTVQYGDAIGNQLTGAKIESKGSVLVSNGNFLENGGGIYINNFKGSNPSTSIPISISDGDFSENFGEGIYILTKSAVTLTNVSASDNDSIKRDLRWSSIFSGYFIDRVFPGDDRGIDSWFFDEYQIDSSRDIFIDSEYTLVVTAYRCERSYVTTIDCDLPANWVQIPSVLLSGTNITIDGSLLDFSDNSIIIQVDGSDNSTQTNYQFRYNPSTDPQFSDYFNSCGSDSPCGLFINNAGNVTIKDSSFSGNSFNGIELISYGSLNFIEVQADGNAGFGLSNKNYVDPIKSISMTGPHNSFSGNGLSGAWLINSSTVSINNLAASGNSGFGAFLDTTRGTGTVSILRVAPDPFQMQNTFDNNGNTGLLIYSRGAIMVKDIHASGNGGEGAYLNNCLYMEVEDKCFGSGTVSILVNPGSKNVFDNNGWTGLYVESKNAIIVNNINSNRNGQGTGSPGTVLDNNWTGASGGVTIGSTSGLKNIFTENGNFGIGVYSKGAISMTNFIANRNFGDGVFFYNNSSINPFPVTLTFGEATENSNGNGVLIRSKGAITITEVDSSANDVVFGWIKAGETLRETLLDSQADEGDSWYFTTASNESDFVIHVESEFDAEFSLWQKIGDDYSITPYTGSGKTWDQVIPFLITGDYFILISSQSTAGGRYSISLDDSSENINKGGAAGFDLSNNITGGVGPIKITGKTTGGSLVANNSSIGVIVDAKGAVTITDINANYNGSLGAIVDNSSSSGAVTIGKINSTFSFNGWDGLRVKANGVIALTNVDAYDNEGNGAVLDNYMNGVGGITILTTGLSSNWYTYFGRNGSDGLKINTKGPVSLKQVGASYNGGNGLVITNQDSPAKAAVSISNGFFSRNGLRGISVETKGAVTLASLNANANEGDFGIRIVNSGTGATNISKVQVNWNDEHGLSVDTTSTITVNALQANENGGYGAKLVSTYNPTTLVNGITFLSTLGQNKFYNNGENLGFLETDLAGLIIQSNKAVVVSQLFSGYNRGNGVMITSSSAVTVTSGLAEYNSLSGLKVTATGGAITLSGFSAYSNGVGNSATETGGVILSSNQKISVSNSAFHGNGDYGIRIFITAPNILTWVNNTAFCNNLDGQAAKNFKLN